MIYRLTRWQLASLVLALFSLSLGAATNSAWHFRAWQAEDGLPEHTIVGLEQTPDGYLWIATHRELCRFDGVRFQEFAPAMSAGAGAQIRAMLRDRHGRLWLNKDGGLVICVEAGKVTQVLASKEVLPGAQARAMAEDGEGSIWVGDSMGSVFRIRDGEVQDFGTVAGLAGQSTCWLATDDRGQLWFSGAGSVGVFRNGAFVTLFKLGDQSGRIAPAREGGVWVCSGLKLFRAQEGDELKTMGEVMLEPSSTEVGVTALYEDKAHGLWVGTSSVGLFRFDSHGFQSVRTSHPNIINILEDSEGNFWVGTRGGGLNRLRPRVVQLLGTASGLPFAAVQSACEDGEGKLWVAGQNGVLARQSNGAWSLVSSNSGWSGGGVACVAAEADGGVLIGTRDKGVFRHRNGAFAPLAQNSQLPNLLIRSLYVRTNGDLWIGINSGVARVRSRDGSLKHFPLPAGASDVRSLIEDANGDVWMGTTSDGLLLRAHDDELINETAKIIPKPDHIRCLQVTSDGSIWFGFAGQGLGWLKNGRYFQFRASHGLWDEYISHILADDRGRLWLAGNRGVFQVARSELEAVAEGRSARARSVIFGREEGLPNLQATFGVCPAATRTADGRLLLPMLTGLAIVDPNLLRKNSLPPPVIIERMMVNGQIAAAYDVPEQADLTNQPAPVSLRATPNTLRLSPGVNSLDFEFTALSLVAAENVTFRYQLEGVNRDWVEAGTERVARYPRVPPGNYRFHVSACSHDGIWNDLGDSLAFSVQPRLWEATWFRVTGALLATGLLSGGILLAVRHRYRLKLERLEQQQALERERTRIAQDLHDDLGAGLVEISFGSALAQDPALGADEAREHTREIGDRAREMVTALDEIVWAVNPKHDDVSSLATYFCQYAQNFLKATPVRCHLDVARNLPVSPLNAEQRHNLFLAFKEALSNAVRHSGAKELRLAISVQQGTLLVSVGDDGGGLDPVAASERTGADGLNNMHRRLEQLGGRCEVTSVPGQGTTVAFKVPLPDSHRVAG